jgi:dolichol kinase
MMKKDVAIRRTIHCLLALAPVYYLLPVDLPMLGVRRWVLLIAFIAIITLIEAIRLPKGIMILGLRPHEKHQIASFVWAAAGITAALWFFPHDIATVVILGMAFVDPLSGELRSHRVGTWRNIGASLLAYFGICLTILFLANDRLLPALLVMAAVGTVIAVGSEQFKSVYVDDDFLMVCAPGLAMTALALVL